MPSSAIRAIAESLDSQQKLLHFVPNNPRQWEFFQALARGVDPWLWCGNRFGKSTVAAVALLMKALGVVPFSLRGLFPPSTVKKWKRGGLYWIVVPDFQQSKDAIEAKINEYFPSSKLAAYTERDHAWYAKDGTRFRLKSCDSVLGKFEGAEVDGAVFDEEPEEEKYNATLVRLMSAKAKNPHAGWHMGAMTPIKGVTWSYDRILEKQQPNIVVIHGSIFDNPIFSQEQVEEFLSSFPSHERKARAYGDALPVAGDPFFDMDALQRHIKGCKDGTKFYIEETKLKEDPLGNLEVWRKPEDGKPYVIGADGASGEIAGDFSVAQVIDASTMEQVASYHGKPTPQVFGSMILPVIARFYKNALVVPELNNHGLTVVDNMINQGRYVRIWVERDLERVGSPVRKAGRGYGFYMTPKSRNAVLGFLEKLVREGPLRIWKQRTCREMTRFVRKDDKYQAAGKRGHDDEVMSLAIACWVAISHRIIPKSIPAAPQRKLSPEEAWEREQEKEGEFLIPSAGY